ncbi:MAG: helix-turn-helix domain-containing protein, partial [Bacteroidaceae bacterium]|nr:helix-turn-helix domain-containing protein [Bacteroidaceae bacterium]
PISRTELEKQLKAEAKAEREKNKPPKVDTKEQTYLLYQEGKSIDEIAALRMLSRTTIEGHLAHYISLGKLPLSEFVSGEKARRIRALLPATSLTEVKEKLGDDVSYGEIKMVMAAFNS